VIRKAILQLVERNQGLMILDLAPLLARNDARENALKVIPPHRRIALSGCLENCPRMALRARGIEVGFAISVNTSLTSEDALNDLVMRVEEIMRDR
jgi:hypothetical protein